MTGLELLVPLAGEMLKLVIAEQNVRKMAAAAGASPEQLEAALVKVRAEVRALDPNTLPEV